MKTYIWAFCNTVLALNDYDVIFHKFIPWENQYDNRSIIKVLLCCFPFNSAMQQAQWGQLFRQGFLSVLITLIAYLFYQIQTFLFLIDNKSAFITLMTSQGSDTVTSILNVIVLIRSKVYVC